MKLLLTIFKPILRLLIPFVVEILKQREESQLEVVLIENDPKQTKFWKADIL